LPDILGDPNIVFGDSATGRSTAQPTIPPTLLAIADEVIE
jgi:hypothetical protein